MNHGQLTGNLQKLLPACLAEVDGSEQYGGGSAFFVAPGYMITCSHVTRLPEESPVSGSWHGVAWSGTIVYASPPAGAVTRQWDPAGCPDDAVWPLPDLAVVRLTTDLDHPCVRLAEHEPTAPANMWAVGRREALGGSPGDFPTARLQYNGMFDRPEGRLMRLVGDTFHHGMSGGPVLDLGTGEVCGVLKVADEDRDGFAIPLSYLREALPAELAVAIRRGHDLYHGRDRSWTEAQDPLYQKMVSEVGNFESFPVTAPLLPPSEEAELLGLAARLAEPTAYTLYRLYAEASGGGRHPDPGELRDFRDLIFQLCNHPHEQHRLHPVVILAELLADHQPQTASGLAGELRNWSTAVTVRQGIRPLLTQQRQAPPTAMPRAGAADGGIGTKSVIIQMEPSSNAPDLYLVTIWCYRSSTDIKVVRRDPTPYPRGEALGQAKETLAKTLRELGDQSAMVELVLPLDLFDEPVQSWEIPGRAFAELGSRHPVIVRDLERFKDEEYRDRARQRWNWLSTLDHTPLTWLDCGERRGARELYRWFEQRRERAAVGMSWPTGQGPGRSFLDAAIFAGVPVAVWPHVRCADHDEEESVVDSCDGLRFQVNAVRDLSATQLLELPQKVRELRNGSSYADSGLALLWDNPDRGPLPRRLHS